MVMPGELNKVLKLPKVFTIGIVVKNLEEAINYYRKAFGWGPWSVNEREDLSEALYLGKHSGCIIKTATFPNPYDPAEEDLDRTTVELIQPLEGESPFHDQLMKRGEGIHHLAVMVDDLQATLVELGRHQCLPIFTFQIELSGMLISGAFLDSPMLGDLRLEVIQVG